MACDIFIARFLSDIKFGNTDIDVNQLNTYGTSTSELKIYEQLAERHIDPKTNKFGTAGEFPDMIGTDRPLTYSFGQNGYITDFAYALADSVRSVIDQAGNQSADHSKRKSVMEKAAEWFINHYPLLGGVATGFRIIETIGRSDLNDIEIAAIDVVKGEIYVNPAAGLTLEAYPRVLLSLAEGQRQISGGTGVVEKGPNKEVLEESQSTQGQHGKAQSQDHVEPKGVAQTLVVTPAIKLRSENARAAGAAEETKVKDKQKLVDNGDTGHGFGADPSHHQIVQQVDKGGNRVLQQQRQGQHRHGPVKLPVSDQFFHCISPYFSQIEDILPHGQGIVNPMPGLIGWGEDHHGKGGSFWRSMW